MWSGIDILAQASLSRREAPESAPRQSLDFDAKQIVITPAEAGAPLYQKGPLYPGCYVQDVIQHTIPNTPVLEAATTSPASEMETTEEPQPRRSGRARKSTLVKVNGHFVLKENNYVLEGGSYKYGDAGDDSFKQKASKRAAQTTKKGTGLKKKSRTLPPHEVKRQEHNSAVRSSIQNKATARLSYLRENLDILQPFIDESTVQKINAVSPIQVPVHELFVQPEGIKGDLRDYQLAGLNWMVKMHRQDLGMILGDEMGLGKTLQTISLFCYLKEHENLTGPSLVVCPLSVLYGWCSELEKWAPHLKVLRLHSSSQNEQIAQRQEFVENADQYDVVVTTYEMAKAPQLTSLWSRQYFHYLVLDEGHRIKNAESQIAQAVRLIHSYNRLILTGTPLQNNLVELWSLLNFLYPDIFMTEEPFSQAFDLTTNTVDKEVLRKAQKLLALFMTRRLKTEVEKLMPKKIETKVICPLSSTQIFWYKSLLLKDINLLARNDDQQVSAANTKLLSNLMMQLRKCCLHPFLFDGVESDINGTTVEELIGHSGKLAVLDKLLRSLYQKGHRVVLFSQFTTVLDVLEDYAGMRGWDYCRFDGSTARAKRNYLVNDFNAPDSTKFLFLMSTRSGGMGLNLQTADTCILYDSDWNPQPDLQAMARVHRIGQTKTVHVYRLVTGGTIEERMVERAEKKLYLDKMVNHHDSSSSLDEDAAFEEKGSEVMKTLKFGCQAVFGADNEKNNTLPTDDDIELITDRSRSEDFSDGKLKGGAASSASDFKADQEFTSTTQLAGIDFKAIRDAQNKKKTTNVPKSLSGIGDMWKTLQSARKRKSRILMVASDGSGYGKKHVPVLSSNNYDLEHGESSVFSRELTSSNKQNFAVQKRVVKRSGVHFDEQDFCQVCGDGGDLLCCPRCPVCVHLKCSGVGYTKNFLGCSHHRCSSCDKNRSDAGGLLFPCQSCPLAFCEDCLPTENKGFRLIGQPPRFQDLGFTTEGFVYIHCSEVCERVAMHDFGWVPEKREGIACPPELDVTELFGAEIDDNVEVSKSELTASRLRQTAKVNYALGNSPSPQVVSAQPGKLTMQSSVVAVDSSDEDRKQSPSEPASLSVAGTSPDEAIVLLESSHDGSSDNTSSGRAPTPSSSASSAQLATSYIEPDPSWFASK